MMPMSRARLAAAPFVLAAVVCCTRIVPRTSRPRLVTAEGKVGVIWVHIDGGTFAMGRADGESDEKPVHTVTVGSFWLAQTEITTGQFLDCVHAGHCKLPSEWEPANPYCNSAADDEQPMGCLTWGQAQRFCRWVGGRLPTEAEWEFAARSRGKVRRFPWGDEAATCDLAIMSSDKHVPNAGCGRDVSWPVCSRVQGDTDQGLCDMAGNVMEWVADRYHEHYYRTSPKHDPRGPARGDQHVLRGGAHLFDDASLTTTGRRSANPNEVFYGFVGARCARGHEEAGQ